MAPLREVVEREPRNASARIALIESLIEMQMLTEAEAAARETAEMFSSDARGRIVTFAR
ncbi:MAG TPA: hypothetical protein VMT00_14825 [Thermoanaerobaculia bacterium]|nr:hypothetical protein [Thermoanaerobaculia bacterium]